MKTCSSCKFFGLWTKECYRSSPSVDHFDGSKTYMQARTFRLSCDGELYQENKVPKLNLGFTLLER